LDGALLRTRLDVLPHGPFPGYVQLVGESADGVTFFVGSILFTAGGALQSWLAWPGWRTPGGRAAWWAAIVQSAGTLFFNATTYQAMHTALTSADYDRLCAAAATEPDPQRRLDLLAQAERILCDDAPIIPLYYYVNAYLFRDDVHGIPLDPRNMVMFRDVYVDRSRTTAPVAPAPAASAGPPAKED
jgi:ABC-type transport system substrate-binding protein